MRQAVTIGLTLITAITLSQLLDRDPVPTSVIPLLWVVTALVLLVELAGLAPLRRAARERPVTVLTGIAAITTVLTALVLMETPRLSAARSQPPAGPVWSTVESPGPALSLAQVAPEMYTALQASSNVEDMAACSAVLRPGDSLGPRSKLQMGELISSPRVKVIPRLTRLRNAVRSMDRVAVLRQVNRTPPSSTEEQRLVQIYDSMLTRSWLVARERRRGSDDLTVEPSLCVYGFADLTSTTFLNEYDIALRAILGL
jgi:hypothetical protein